jgi:hypothetical protein
MKLIRWQYIGYGVRVGGVLLLIGFEISQQLNAKGGAHWSESLSTGIIVLIACVLSKPSSKKLN